jgi:hypothetical protein
MAQDCLKVSPAFNPSGLPGLMQHWNCGKKMVFHFDTTGWSSHEWVHFLKNLPGEISLEDMEALDRQFAFTKQWQCGDFGCLVCSLCQKPLSAGFRRHGTLFSAYWKKENS